MAEAPRCQITWLEDDYVVATELDSCGVLTIVTGRMHASGRLELIDVRAVQTDGVGTARLGQCEIACEEGLTDAPVAA